MAVSCGFLNQASNATLYFFLVCVDVFKQGPAGRSAACAHATDTRHERSASTTQKAARSRQLAKISPLEDRFAPIMVVPICSTHTAIGRPRFAPVILRALQPLRSPPPACSRPWGSPRLGVGAN